MLNRGVGPGGSEWRIATEREFYFREYIPRVCQFSASRETKIEDLYDKLNPSGTAFRPGGSEPRPPYYRALEILLAGPTKTRPELLDLRDPASRPAFSEQL